MQSNQFQVISAASDGACSGNPGPGGWGVLIRYENGKVEEFGGFEPNTTNNRMELKATLKAFERLKELSLHPKIIIKTDSKYVINGLSKWIVNWKKKGWLTASGKAVLNQDLWKKLDKSQLKEVKLVYVKGHSGDEDNERVDKIAVAYSKNKETELNLSKRQNATNLEKKDELKERSPHNIKKLFSRLEIINAFAEKGYGLTSKEISELLNYPIEEVESKSNTWEWRQWLIEPITSELWKLKIKTHNNQIKNN